MHPRYAHAQQARAHRLGHNRKDAHMPQGQGQGQDEDEDADAVVRLNPLQPPSTNSVPGSQAILPMTGSPNR